MHERLRSIANRGRGAKAGAALLTTLLLASPCFAAPTPAQQEARAIFYRFGQGYTQAAIDLATPSSVRTSKADGDLLLKEFRGAGVQASWLESPQAPKTRAPMGLQIRRDGHVVNDISVGISSPADVQRQLGMPDERGTGWIAYRGLAEICSDRFTFRFANGRLSEVDWQWCAD